jgi:CheY-like chemotaxis protein
MLCRPGACPAAETGSRSSAGAPALEALQTEAGELERSLSLTNQLRLYNEEQQRRSASSRNGHVDLVLIVGAVVCGALMWRMLAARFAVLTRSLNPWGAMRVECNLAAEQQAFSQFAEAFAAGPSLPAMAAPLRGSAVAAKPAGIAALPARHVDSVEDFLRGAPKQLAGMRAIFSGIGCAPDIASRRKILGDLTHEVAALKAKSQPPSLRPFWQMASALEALLGQLARQSEEVSPSALRTIASALDLLNSLCLPGLRPDLATQPPVRVLAVDDDAICRHAISLSLQKVLCPPDLASDGAAALALAQGLAYDVIFLDVEMPGMDGFEVCSRIRTTLANRTTPVVFVTRHSDFGSRAKSSLSGGRDLIGKPFLTFELALKALTIVIQRRSQTNARERMGLPGVAAEPVSERPSQVGAESKQAPAPREASCPRQ